MLSTLIVNWNTRDLLVDCLESLRQNPPDGPSEVIVVDNASSDGSADAVRNRFPEITLIEPGANLGYAAGNNRAFGAAKGEWLLTLNPDTVIAEGQLQAVIDALGSKPGFGCAAPRLVGRDGALQRSVRGFPTFLGILGDMTGLGKLFPGSRLDSYRLSSMNYGLEGEAPQPMGTFLLFRREALAKVGDPKAPFDESFPIFFNEVDLLYRLKKAGLPCLFVPTVAVQHLGGASTRQVKKAMIWESHRSLLRFFVKHHRTALNAWAFPILSLVVLGGALIRARGFSAGFRP